jgi:hypothetical protein
MKRERKKKPEVKLIPDLYTLKDMIIEEKQKLKPSSYVSTIPLTTIECTIYDKVIEMINKLTSQLPPITELAGFKIGDYFTNTISSGTYEVVDFPSTRTVKGRRISAPTLGISSDITLHVKYLQHAEKPVERKVMKNDYFEWNGRLFQAKSKHKGLVYGKAVGKGRDTQISEESLVIVENPKKWLKEHK